MNFILSITESMTKRLHISILSLIVATVFGCFLCLFYFFYESRAATTNATWHALTEDALSNHSKARDQWAMNARKLLYGGLKKVNANYMRNGSNR